MIDAMSQPRGAWPTQVVAFTCDGRAFGVDVHKVREIRGWQAATPMPNTASDVLGVINLRGVIVPVHDLAIRLGCSSGPRESGVIIVVEIEGQLVGILAETVSDILDIDPASVKPTGDVMGLASAIVAGLVLRGESIIALLDLNAVTGSRDDLSFAA
jgi:purine-binding chemotaxis protein CheW